MASVPVNPTSFRFPYGTVEAHPSVINALRLSFQGTKDANDAIVALATQHSQTVTSVKVVQQQIDTLPKNVVQLDANGKLPISTIPLGGVNVQTSSPYTLQGSDYGGVVVTDTAGAFALTLDGSLLGNNFWSIIQNIGPGLLTSTPASGTVNNVSSISTTAGNSLIVAWDGTNWWAATITTGNLTEATSAVLTISGGTNAVVGTGTTIQVIQSGAATSGYLSSTDWNTFNGKVDQTKLLFSVTTAQFDKTDTTLANITGLTENVSSGKTYRFRAVLHVTADAVGGHKYAISGTATATSIIYEINSLSNDSNLNVIASRQTALGGSAGQAGSTHPYTEINGVIVVNAGGTLTVQFAENAASATSSVLVGSSFEVYQVP